MGSEASSWRDLVDLSKRAVNCNDCFKQLGQVRAFVGIAQPRIVGSNYWTAQPKVLVLMINPGSGAGTRAKADRKLSELLYRFKNGQDTLKAVYDHQAEDMKDWARGSFAKYLFDKNRGLGLEPEEIALANVAWCSTKGNKYPPNMLRHCFEKHTRELVKLLCPDIVVLSGEVTFRFVEQIQDEVPSASFIQTLHSTSRRSSEEKQREYKRVREKLSALAQLHR